MLKLKQIKDIAITSPLNGQILQFDNATKKWTNKQAVKTWYGTTFVSGTSGQWSIDFTAANFTSIPIVVAQTWGGTDQGTRTFTSLISVTRTSATGACNTSTTVGLLLTYINTHAPNGTRVDIIAVGV